ncbi:DUF6044 family protein [Algoriphagus halophytocola]|uniref:DUF6044 family protein n=1 Tax=Algoriphagus halophytocola TaxID=2991499 RepID=UPI0022DE2921|nr:DUF6044 family protein [Algoriphagus sp. TR-M9]WBL41259.1 DUF6044 family protein [Algoriphagus sp. TR-M9]
MALLKGLKITSQTLGAYLLAFLVFVLLLLPYFIFGKDVFLPVSDNMDSNLAWYKMLKDQGKIFTSWNTPVQGMMVELPRFSFPSGYNLEMLLYALFPFFKAYILNKALIIIIAFFSFRYWLRGQELVLRNTYLEVFLCLLWASLAFYPHRGISIAALPAVIQVFTLLLNGKASKNSILILLGYAIYSMFALAALYFMLGILIWLIFACIIERKIHLPALLAWCFLWGLFLLQDFQLIRGYFLNPDFVSHRGDFTYDFGIWIQHYPWDFFSSGDQNGVHYTPVYMVFLIGLCLYSGYKKLMSKKGLLFLVLLLGISMLLSILSITGNVNLIGRIVPQLGSLNLLRFEYWIPFLMVASIINFWSKLKFRWSEYVITVLLMINIFAYQYEWRYGINTHLQVLEQKVPTYKSYFAEAQFDQLTGFLGDGSEQALFINFNLPPAVATFNGLKTFDGYVQVYGKAHKQKVFQVIEAELEKDQSLKAHFLNWGNKCYFQNAQYPDDYFMYKWREEEPLSEPDFDYQYLKKELQVDYILSALPVVSDQMNLLKVFENEHSAWRIHLYELK